MAARTRHIFYTWDTSGAVDKDEDHSTKRPSNSQKTHAPTIRSFAGSSNDNGDGDIQKQQSRNKLRYYSSVERPTKELPRIHQWWMGWVLVVLLELMLTPLFCNMAIITLVFGCHADPNSQSSATLLWFLLVRIWAFYTDQQLCFLSSRSWVLTAP